MSKITQTTKDVKHDEQITSPYCQVNCKICNSGHADVVREMVQSGTLYSTIVDHLKNEYDFSVSPSGITRHWKNYKKALMERGKEIELARFDEEADELVRHQKQTTLIVDGMFDLIAKQIEAGTLPVSIADYTSLLKIRHGVLTGDNGAMNDLVGIFQQATDKYGVNLQQGVLFNKKKE